jgi:nucleotide-binding universal stress UspA family protein
MFKKILVPMDGPEWEAKVLPHVEDLAKAFRAEVTLFNSPTFGIKKEIREAGIGVIEEFIGHEEAEKHLVEVTNALNAKGIKANYIYKEEKMPVREGIAYAGNDNDGLIAVASRAKGDVTWVLGSVGSTDEVKETPSNTNLTVIAVAAGLMLSIAPFIMSMLF